MTGVEGCRANPRSERRGRGDPHDNVDGAFQALASERLDVVIVLQTSMLLSERQKIARLAAAMRLPIVYGYREHVVDGGLIGYGSICGSVFAVPRFTCIKS